MQAEAIRIRQSGGEPDPAHAGNWITLRRALDARTIAALIAGASDRPDSDAGVWLTERIRRGSGPADQGARRAIVYEGLDFDEPVAELGPPTDDAALVVHDRIRRMTERLADSDGPDPRERVWATANALSLMVTLWSTADVQADEVNLPVATRVVRTLAAALTEQAGALRQGFGPDTANAAGELLEDASYLLELWERMAETGRAGRSDVEDMADGLLATAGRIWQPPPPERPAPEAETPAAAPEPAPLQSVEVRRLLRMAADPLPDPLPDWSQDELERLVELVERELAGPGISEHPAQYQRNLELHDDILRVLREARGGRTGLQPGDGLERDYAARRMQRDAFQLFEFARRALGSPGTGVDDAVRAWAAAKGKGYRDAERLVETLLGDWMQEEREAVGRAAGNEPDPDPDVARTLARIEWTARLVAADPDISPAFLAAADRTVDRLTRQLRARAISDTAERASTIRELIAELRTDLSPEERAKAAARLRAAVDPGDEGDGTPATLPAPTRGPDGEGVLGRGDGGKFDTPRLEDGSLDTQALFDQLTQGSSRDGSAAERDAGERLAAAPVVAAPVVAAPAPGQVVSVIQPVVRATVEEAAAPVGGPQLPPVGGPQPALAVAKLFPELELDDPGLGTGDLAVEPDLVVAGGPIGVRLSAPGWQRP